MMSVWECNDTGMSCWECGVTLYSEIPTNARVHWATGLFDDRVSDDNSSRLAYSLNSGAPLIVVVGTIVADPDLPPPFYSNPRFTVRFHPRTPLIILATGNECSSNVVRLDFFQYGLSPESQILGNPTTWFPAMRCFIFISYWHLLSGKYGCNVTEVRKWYREILGTS